ncbi:CNP1-like family protein [Aromatoleum sp.]|uniref:CNP1-like family protein n=1 Tax=Aromatoleum sp. TaxID=2307007 RepID=UPI002FC7C99A
MALVCFSGPACAGLFTEPDPDWKEGEYQVPAPLRDPALREIEVDSTSRNRVLIDENSLTVGGDGVVRYVMVARAGGGAENSTFEGIRCETREWRIYAAGRPGGQWANARDASWKPIVDSAYSRPRAVLANNYFCDGAVPPRDRDEVLRRLRGIDGGPLKPTP